MNGSPSRTLSASAALVVLVALPSVVSRGESKEPQSKPAEGALVLQLSGGDGVSRAYLVRTKGPGAVPDRAAALHNAAGDVTATVTPTAAPCDKAVARTAFSAGTEPWCLKIESLENGAEVTGELQSDGGEKLSLTVRSRDAFWCWPFVVLILGLLAGLLALVFQPWLRRRVRELVLTRIVRANARSRDREKRIEQLDTWVRARAADGATIESLIRDVETVTGHGPARASSARKRLRAALDAVPELREYELVQEGERIADTANHVDDFFGSDGAAQDEHPADTRAHAVSRLAALDKALTDLDKALDALDTSTRVGLATIVSQTRDALKAVDQPAALDPFDGRIADLRSKIEDALMKAAGPTGPRRASRGRPGESLLPHLDLWRRPPIVPLGLVPPARKWLATRALASLTGLAVLVICVYAIVSIKHTAYDPKPLFDGFGDYLELFSAAVGSGAAATVLALVSDWRPAATEDAPA